MQMDLPNTATLGAAIGEGLAGLLVVHVLLMLIHAVALLVSLIRRPRLIPSDFRTFLRAAGFIHCVALVLSIANLGLLYARPELDVQGFARFLLLRFGLLPALPGLLLVRFLIARTAPDAPLSLAL